MAIFDVRCRNCGLEREILLWGFTVEETYCPECNSLTLEKKPVALKSYTIKGDNSASITPKRHRQEKTS